MGPTAVEVLRGPASSGKTQALVERAARLAGEGVAAEDMLAVTPTPDGAVELGARLQARLGDSAPRAVSQGRLAFELAGCPRVLGSTERSVLLADVRAAGFSAAQVSAALKAADDAWGRGVSPVPGDDACLRTLLGLLERRGAVLPEALWALAGARAGRGFPHVLVDDADVLPPAVLGMLAGCAREGLFIVADDEVPINLGLHDADVVLTDLPAPARRVRARRFQAVKWADAAEEAAGAAALADHVLAARGEASGPVVLSVPNRAWARRACQALERAGVEAWEGGCTQPLACDPRDPAGCAPLRCFAALGLVADAGDAASWRAWCALGHADLACASWRNLESYARQQGLGLVEALRRACAEADAGRAPFAGALQLAARVHETRAFMGKADLPKRGLLLLDALDPARTPAFRQLFARASDELAGMAAPALFQVALQGAFDPALGVLPCEVRGACSHEGAAEAGRRVLVCLPERLVGVHPHLLVCLGCNERLHRGCGLDRALGTQADELVVSYLQRMPEEAARKMGAAYRRTRVEEGCTLALLQPDARVAALGGEAPATMSGQQFCSTVLGVRP